jgi:hypothetical protein
MQGFRNKDPIDAAREKAKKLGLTPEDVKESVGWARSGERTEKSLIEVLPSSQNSEDEGLMFGPTEAEIDSHPYNGKRGIWRVNGVRHSCLVSGVSTAREARDRAIANGAVQEWELYGIEFLGELPEVFRF